MGVNDKLILENTLYIREDIGAIKEHLKTLNGKVIKQEGRIQCLETDSQANKIMWAKIGGIASGVSFISTIVLNYLIKIWF